MFFFFSICSVVSVFSRTNDNMTTMLIHYWWENSEWRPIRFVPLWIFCINTHMFVSNEKRVWLGLPLDAVGQWKSRSRGSAHTSEPKGRSCGLVKAWLAADIKGGCWLLEAGTTSTPNHISLFLFDVCRV